VGRVQAVWLQEGRIVATAGGWGRADRKYLAMLESAAAGCQECGECESRCPYHLPLASMVRPTALRIAERVRAEIARQSD